MTRSAYLLHIHRYKKINKRKQIKQFDKFVLTMSFIQPMSGIPQAITIWTGSGQASLLSWILFAIFGVVMLSYGLIHRIKPIIVTNIIWTAIDLVIIVGLLRV